jgi:hypothetical protein
VPDQEMTEIKRPLKVFLYHAPADKITARDLYLRLIQEGMDARVVKEKLLPGQDWKEELETAFHEADAVILCVSERFSREEFRQKEARLALDIVVEQLQDENFVIPARLEECDLPEPLQKWRPVDLFKNVGYDVLLYALHLRAEKIGATIETREDSLPRIAEPNVNDEQPIPPERPAEAIPGTLETIDGTGILIEGTGIKPYRPGWGILLALLGITAILTMSFFGPAWIENSQPPTATPEKKATPTPVPRTARTPILTPPVIAIPTLAWERDF